MKFLNEKISSVGKIMENGKKVRWMVQGYCCYQDLNINISNYYCGGYIVGICMQRFGLLGAVVYIFCYVIHVCVWLLRKFPTYIDIITLTPCLVPNLVSS